MRLNKILQGLAIALPVLVLSACSSSSSTEADAQTETNQAVEQTTSQTQDAVQVSAAQRAAAIEEEKRQQLAMLQKSQTVYFDFDVSRISPEYADVLDAHAKFLTANSNVNVLIEGHADERGTPEYNIALGERRAKAVATYLENLGVSSSQISVVSYGEEKPVDTAKTEAAFAKNRRAVLVY